MNQTTKNSAIIDENLAKSTEPISVKNQGEIHRERDNCRTSIFKDLFFGYKILFEQSLLLRSIYQRIVNDFFTVNIWGFHL